MYNLEQIAYIIKDKTLILKDALERKEPVHFNHIYLKAVDQEERISIHSELGKFPMSLFTKRAPNQTDEEFEYLKANYKTSTFPVWSRFISNLGRLWNDNNWSIQWPEGATKEGGITDYLDYEYPFFNSYESYFKNIVSVTKERDPNAVIAIKPLDLPIKQDSVSTIHKSIGNGSKPFQ